MYRVEIASAAGTAFTGRSKDCVIPIDIHGQGMTPPDLLLAGLGSCVGVYLRKYAQGAKLALGDFLITVEAELSLEPPVCFRAINVQIDLKGLSLDERRQKALADFVHNCPVHNTLKGSPLVAIQFR